MKKNFKALAAVTAVTTVLTLGLAACDTANTDEPVTSTTEAAVTTTTAAVTDTTTTTAGQTTTAPTTTIAPATTTAPTTTIAPTTTSVPETTTAKEEMPDAESLVKSITLDTFANSTKNISFEYGESMSDGTEGVTMGGSMYISQSGDVTYEKRTSREKTAEGRETENAWEKYLVSGMEGDTASTTEYYKHYTSDYWSAYKVDDGELDVDTEEDVRNFFDGLTDLAITDDGTYYCVTGNVTGEYDYFKNFSSVYAEYESAAAVCEMHFDKATKAFVSATISVTFIPCGKDYYFPENPNRIEYHTESPWGEPCEYYEKYFLLGGKEAYIYSDYYKAYMGNEAGFTYEAYILRYMKDGVKYYGVSDGWGFKVYKDNGEYVGMADELGFDFGDCETNPHWEETPELNITVDPIYKVSEFPVYKVEVAVIDTPVTVPETVLSNMVDDVKHPYYEPRDFSFYGSSEGKLSYFDSTTGKQTTITIPAKDENWIFDNTEQWSVGAQMIVDGEVYYMDYWMSDIKAGDEKEIVELITYGDAEALASFEVNGRKVYYSEYSSQVCQDIGENHYLVIETNLYGGDNFVDIVKQMLVER